MGIGPKINRDEERGGAREFQREQIQKLDGRSAAQIGEYGQKMNATVVDEIAAAYKPHMKGYPKLDPLAEKVASGFKYDPSRVDEKMAEAGRDVAAGRLDRRKAVERVEKAMQLAKEDQRDHLVVSYQREADNRDERAASALRKVEFKASAEGQAPELRTEALAVRQKAAELRAKEAVTYLKAMAPEGDPEKGKRMLEALAGPAKDGVPDGGLEARAEARLKVLYGGLDVAKSGKSTLGTEMMQSGALGRDQVEDTLTASGELRVGESMLWTGAEGREAQVVGKAVAELVEAQRRGDVMGEAQAKVSAIGSDAESFRGYFRAGLGDLSPAQEEAAKAVFVDANAAELLRKDAAMLGGLRLQDMEGRKALMEHLVALDPKKADEHMAEVKEFKRFERDAGWNEESMLNIRRKATAGYHVAAGGLKAGWSFLEGASEWLMKILQATHEAQNHTARGDVLGVAGSLKAGSFGAVSHAVDIAGTSVGHGHRGLEGARNARFETQRRAEQVMGRYTQRHEMNQRVAEIAMSQSREGMEMLYNYGRAFQVAAEATRDAAKSKDPIEKGSMLERAGQSRREMNVHLARLRAEHPEFYDLVEAHPKLSPAAADLAMDRISDPRVFAGATLTTRAAQAGLAVNEGGNGTYNPVLGLGLDKTGERQIVASMKGGVLEFGDLTLQGGAQGSPIGSVRAEDWKRMNEAFDGWRGDRVYAQGGEPEWGTDAEREGWKTVKALRDRCGDHQIQAVGKLAFLNTQINGHPELLSSMNPWHADCVQAVNAAVRAGDPRAIGLTEEPTHHAAREIGDIARANSRVQYKTPMELQAFFEEVVAMRVAAEFEEHGAPRV